MSEDADLKVGDTVSLKIGGPIMIIHSVDGSSVTCDWPVKSDIKRKSFAAEELTKVDITVPINLEQLLLIAEERREAKTESK
jgi:uncharacterized protein YodC (DUF2158 family)